ncbi:hypothetical protein C0993_004315 [Termitomyces sp. T159_Od127]|nr:hypothetical protein C0993_004315 [Termitomyces sp. T159_Od127]
MSVEEPATGVFTLTPDADAPGQAYNDLNDLDFDFTFLFDAPPAHQQSYPKLYTDAEFQALFETQKTTLDDSSSDWSTLTEYEAIASPQVAPSQHYLVDANGSQGSEGLLPAYLPPAPAGPNPLVTVPYPTPLDADTTNTPSDWSRLTESDALTSPQLASFPQSLLDANVSQGSAGLLPHVPAYLPPTPAGPNPFGPVPDPTPTTLEFADALGITELELIDLLRRVADPPPAPAPVLPFFHELAPAPQAPVVPAAFSAPTPPTAATTNTNTKTNGPPAPSPPAAQPTRSPSPSPASPSTDLGTIHAPSITCLWATCTTTLTCSSFPTSHAFSAQVHAHLAAHERDAAAARTRAPDGRWRWKCEWERCGKTFCDRRALGRHLRSNRHVVGAVRVRFECAMCGRAWTRKGERDGHVKRVHASGVEGVGEGGEEVEGEGVEEEEEGRPVKRRRV